jgi:heme-degrading monooxygenase HmoA
MIARIEERQALPTDLDPTYIARYRAWIAEQPGFCGGYHLLDPQTGHALSLTMWENDDELAAAERAQSAGNGPADGRVSRQSQPTVRIVHVAAVI